MRRYFVVCLLPLGLRTTVLSAQEAAPTPITPELAATYFAEFDKACGADGGRLWGVSICGPVLLVDPATRTAIGNRADKKSSLQAQGNAYVGHYPPDKPLANAPIPWSGVRWAVILTTFVKGETADRVTLLAHEAFHRVQPRLGLFAFGKENNHLDTLEGRYWMQLEWAALEQALSSQADDRMAALEDALDFRAQRRNRVSQSASRENAVEIREGLAQYTGLRIAGRTSAEVVRVGRAKRMDMDGIVRSFAYISGPLYGYLLDEADPAWRKSVAHESDLGHMLAAAMDLEPDPGRATQRAAMYGGPSLRAEEEQRERDRLQRLAEWRSLLVDGPVLIVDLSLVRSGTMDTRAVHPLDENRIVFMVRKLIADWGVLEVDGGALLEDRTEQRGYLSLKDARADHSAGKGWTLTPADGWAIKPGQRKGDFVLSGSP